MACREVHFLCVLKSNISYSLGDLLVLCESFNLSVGKIKTCRRIYLDPISLDYGDIIVELISFSSVSNDKIIAAVENLGSGANAQILPVENIMVKAPLP